MSSIYMHFKLIHNCTTNPLTLLHDTESCILFVPFSQAYVCNEYADTYFSVFSARVHNVDTCRRGNILPLSARSIYETTEMILIKSGIWIYTKQFHTNVILICIETLQSLFYIKLILNFTNFIINGSDYKKLVHDIKYSAHSNLWLLRVSETFSDTANIQQNTDKWLYSVSRWEIIGSCLPQMNVSNNEVCKIANAFEKYVYSIRVQLSFLVRQGSVLYFCSCDTRN